MFWTKTTEYAMRTLIFMATHDCELYSTNFLSEELKIPHKYLSRIMTDLVRSELIESIKGRSGGFRIAKPLDQISLLDIYTAVEGREFLTSCILGFKECSDENPCALHFIWEKSRSQMLKILQDTTLAYFRAIRSKIKRY